MCLGRVTTSDSGAGVTSVRTIPVGEGFQSLSVSSPSRRRGVICSSKTVRTRDLNSRAEFAFYKIVPSSCLVAVATSSCLTRNRREDRPLGREGFRDPLFSHLLGVYLVADAATGRLEMDCWCNKPRNQCSILISSRWSS